MALDLTELGFDVLPSQANFLFVKPPGSPACDWYEGLRRQKILVRWFAKGECNNRLRITIGSKDEMKQCLDAILILKKRLG